MLAFLTKIRIVPKPPIRGITCVVIGAMGHVMSSVTSALNKRLVLWPTFTIVTITEHSC